MPMTAAFLLCARSCRKTCIACTNPANDAASRPEHSSTAFSEDDSGGLSLREAAAAARAPPPPPGVPALLLPGTSRGAHFHTGTEV